MHSKDSHGFRYGGSYVHDASQTRLLSFFKAGLNFSQRVDSPSPAVEKAVSFVKDSMDKSISSFVAPLSNKSGIVSGTSFISLCLSKSVVVTAVPHLHLLTR